MKKSTLVVISLVMSAFTLPAFAGPQFNNEQLKKFEQTNECSGCDLSSARIGDNHSGAILNNANLSNIRAKIGGILNFSYANLQNANFSGAELEESNLSFANLTGAHFAGAVLGRTNFYGAVGLDLTNAYVCYVILPDGKTSDCK